MSTDPNDTFFVYKISSAGIWSINPYRACPHRCVYCISGHQGDATPWFGKEQLITQLTDNLSRIPHDTELFIGSVVDAYPAAESKLEYTRTILEELSRQRRPFCVGTKSALVCRDIDILSRHPVHCDVYLSLCSLEEDALRRLEPGAPSVSERLVALSELADAGIDVNIDAAPWIPGLSHAEELIRRIPENRCIQFAPLDTSTSGGRMTLLGKTYTQAEINTAYRAEAKRIGNLPGVWWKDPPVLDKSN